MNELRFNWEWADYVLDQPSHWHCTFADLDIHVGSFCLTRHRSELYGALEDRVQLPLYELAEWAAVNWWHLLYEVNDKRTDYLLRHSIKGAGGGFFLPDVRFKPLGNHILVHGIAQYRPYGTTAYFEGSRHGDFFKWIDKENFVGAFTALIEAVTARLENAGITDTHLQTRWAEIQTFDADEQKYLQALAHLGLFPEDTDESQVNALISLTQQLGFDTAIELFEAIHPEELAYSQSQVGSLLQKLQLSKSQGVNESWLQLTRAEMSKKPAPWQKGYLLAERLLKEIGLSAVERKRSSPEATDDFLDQFFSRLKWSHTIDNATMPAGVDALTANTAPTNLHVFTYKKDSSLRFLRARILGDILSNGSASVHLFTQSYLPKQQLNRAFAAELLMPAELLHSYLGPKQKHFENDQIQDIADQHGLSYMTVMHSAENRGLLAEKRLEFQGTW